MAFTRFTKSVLNVSALPDRVQNQAQTLKATFDQAGADIKVALNTLIAELEASTASSNIGADVPSVTTKTVQAILSAFEEEILNRYTKNEIDTLVSGNTNNLVADVDVNLTTGVITVTKKDGTIETFDTALEKVPAKFEIVENGPSLFLKITNVDGTSTQTDITELMNVYDFNNTSDIAFNVSGTGNEKVVTASIRSNSIGLDKLSLSVVSTLEGYMTSARDSANAAKISENNARNSANIATKAAETAAIAEGLANTAINKATEAESYAHGGTGTREGEDTDNAKYYSQVAKEVVGGDFVTQTEMEAYAQKKGTVPSFEGEELSGEVIETELPLALESKLNINGNSEQDSRSGKNLVDYTKFTTLSTGTITLINEGINVKGKWGVTTPVSLLAGTYYFKADVEVITAGDWSSGIRFRVQYTDNNYSNYIENNSSMNFTKDIKAVLIYVSSGTTEVIAEVNITNIMVSKEDLPYEPYGVQPSPDYPSEIRSVKSKSDNLFDISTKKDNTSFTWADGNEYTGQGTSGSILSDYIPVNGVKTLSSNYKFYIAYYDNSKAYLGNSENLTTSGGTTYTNNCHIPSNSDIAYFRVWYRQGSTYNDIDMTTVTDLMLNKGTEALPYQPYGYVPVEAKVEGKNKFNINGDVSTTYKGTTSNANTVSGNNLTSTSNWRTTHGPGQKIYVGTGNTVTVSAKLVAVGSEYTGTSTVGSIALYNEGNIERKGISYKMADIGVVKSLSFTAETDYIIVAFGAYTEYVSSVTFTDIQLEIGTTATEYVPYQTKTISLPLGDIELRSTPDGTRDTFERVDGVWNKVSNVGSVIFDGSIGGYSQADNWYYVGLSGAGIAIKNTSLICDYFIQATMDELRNKNTGIAYNANSVSSITHILIKNHVFTSADEYKTWLANNNTTINYVLATPTYTPITDTTLIQALDTLEQLILHKGYNRITVTSVNGVKAYLDLEIPATASVTNVVKTNEKNDMIVPIVKGEGNVLVKIPTENKMTLNPSTGLVKVPGIEFKAGDIGVAQVRNIYAGTEELTPGVSPLPTGTIYIQYE